MAGAEDDHEFIAIDNALAVVGHGDRHRPRLIEAGGLEAVKPGYEQLKDGYIKLFGTMIVRPMRVGEVALHRFEADNGFGDYVKKINSRYLWSFSNHCTKGKFVRDGIYAPEAVSKQCGAAVRGTTLVDNREIVL